MNIGYALYECVLAPFSLEWVDFPRVWALLLSGLLLSEEKGKKSIILSLKKKKCIYISIFKIPIIKSKKDTYMEYQKIYSMSGRVRQDPWKHGKGQSRNPSEFQDASEKALEG